MIEASLQRNEVRGRWQAVCRREDLVPNSGVVAWVSNIQVALFYLKGEEGDQLFAVQNHDPLAQANVIGRGIVGHLGGNLVIASPLYKQHYRLEDGSCLEYPEQKLRVWPVRLQGDVVEVGVE
ncbi:nitrite reductase small subunit NirD [Metapseudomonas lalkuanensis]|uniref:Nitrite reductase small subunit NirD n=1 Tax=Metapseudomonas lalkuanensis TaxID=2604832 RepID=A0A5J6QJP3_9GAMM|nr:nitrite reductase small subunit NirD [Pseudomonas lalkuanensis]QEY62005.1 nitrite reductase small subunit NirD [Pseudomonas lalkuanensis]